MATKIQRNPKLKVNKALRFHAKYMDAALNTQTKRQRTNVYGFKLRKKAQ